MERYKYMYIKYGWLGHKGGHINGLVLLTRLNVYESDDAVIFVILNLSGLAWRFVIQIIFLSYIEHLHFFFNTLNSDIKVERNCVCKLEQAL